MTQLKLISREPTEETWILMLNAAWEAMNRSNYPAPYNQMRDAITAAFDAAPHIETETEKLALGIAYAEDRGCGYWKIPFDGLVHIQRANIFKATDNHMSIAEKEICYLCKIIHALLLERGIE